MSVKKYSKKNLIRLSILGKKVAYKWQITNLQSVNQRLTKFKPHIFSIFARLRTRYSDLILAMWMLS